MFAPDKGYQQYRGDELSIFDVRDPAAVARLHELRAIWQGESDIQALDEDRYVLLRRFSNNPRRWAA